MTSRLATLMKILKPMLLALTCAFLLAFTHQITQETIQSNQRHYEERVRPADCINPELTNPG